MLLVRRKNNSSNSSSSSRKLVRRRWRERALIENDAALSRRSSRDWDWLICPLFFFYFLFSFGEDFDSIRIIFMVRPASGLSHPIIPFFSFPPKGPRFHVAIACTPITNEWTTALFSQIPCIRPPFLFLLCVLKLLSFSLCDYTKGAPHDTLIAPHQQAVG